MAQNLQQNTYWATFPATYRAEQIAMLAQWITVGDSGVVVGGGGAGKSNLVGFIAGRPDVLGPQLPHHGENTYFLHLDMNSLPTVTTSNFYRGLLYAMQQAIDWAIPELAPDITELIAKIINGEDALALYFALQRAHYLLIHRANKQVVWLLDRFDEACKRLDAGTLSSLRSLRDQFKGKLSYITFTRLPLARLRNPAEFDEFHEIMVARTC